MPNFHLLAVLPPLVGGYLLTVGIARLRYLLVGQSGQRFILAVAVLAALLAVGGHFVANLIILGVTYLASFDSSLQPSSLRELWHFVSPVPLRSAMALLMAGVLSSWFYFRERRNNAVRMKALGFAMKQRGDGLQSFLLKAYNDAKPVSLTMENGKVYVGILKGIDKLLHHNDAYIELLPIMSGHRIGSMNDNNASVENAGVIYFNSFYHDLVEKYYDAVGVPNNTNTLPNSGSDSSQIAVDGRAILIKLDELGTLLPIADVRSANIFSEEIYAFVNRERHPDLWEIASTPKHSSES